MTIRVTRTRRRTGRPRSSAMAVVAAIGIVAMAGTSTTADAVVVPTVGFEAGPDATVAEGSLFARSVVVTDGEDNGEPGWTYTVDYGDGVVSSGVSIGVPTIELDHTYPDGPALHSVNITVTDTAGETATDNFVVSVFDVLPTVSIVAAASTTEGATYTLQLSVTDPAGPYDTTWFALDWGDGFSAQVLRPAGTYNHIFADDEAGPINATLRNITVGVWPDDGVGFNRIVPVVVNNVAPTLALAGAGTAQVGTPYALTLGAITDPGKDTVSSRTIQWGDGTSQTVTTGGTFEHTYTAARTASISVELTDEDGIFAGAGALPVTVSLRAPTAPQGLTATATSRSSIQLNWTNTSTTQTSVTVERCKGVSCTTFSRVATLSGASATYLSTGLSSRTSYTYRVRAGNAAGQSLSSNTASATTPR